MPRADTAAGTDAAPRARARHEPVDTAAPDLPATPAGTTHPAHRAVPLQRTAMRQRARTPAHERAATHRAPARQRVQAPAHELTRAPARQRIRAPRARARQHTGARPHAEASESSRRPAGPDRAARGTPQHSPEHQPIAAPPHSPEQRHAGATPTAAERTGHHGPSACTTASASGRTARREPGTPAPEVGTPAAPLRRQWSAAAGPAPRRSAHHPPERRDPSRSAATGAWPATPAPTPRPRVHEDDPLPKIRNTPTRNAPVTTHRAGTATPGPAPTGARTATPATASTPVRTHPRAQTTPRAKPAASTAVAAQPALPLDRELLERVLAGLHRL